MDNDNLLLRQIHPNFIQGSKASVGAFEAGTIAFTPNASDNGQLSVYNGEKYDAQQSFEHYISIKGEGKSGGVMGVTNGECLSVSLQAEEDNNPYDGHSYVDFNALDPKLWKGCAKELKRLAHERGWLHRP